MFQRFGNGDLDVKDKQRSVAPEKFKDDELESLLDEESCQALEKLSESIDELTVSKRLKGMIYKKQGNWLPHDLQKGDIASETRLDSL